MTVLAHVGTTNDLAFSLFGYRAHLCQNSSIQLKRASSKVPAIHKRPRRVERRSRALTTTSGRANPGSQTKMASGALATNVLTSWRERHCIEVPQIVSIEHGWYWSRGIVTALGSTHSREMR